MNILKSFQLLLFVLTIILTTSPAMAGPFISQAPFVDAEPGALIPGPTQVPGKTYSNNLDRNANPTHVADPLQNIDWDGNGGTQDGWDYGDNGEVDALANRGDVLFDSVIRNRSALLFSTDADPNIYFESIFGAGGIWAPPPQIDQVFPNDVDGLNVWSVGSIRPITPEGWTEDPTSDVDPDDTSNRYSLLGDSIIDLGNGRRISVFDFFGSGVYYSDELANAIAGLTGIGAIDTDFLIDNLDLDAMMISGEEIMWSIDPILLPSGTSFDGGEIFVWDRNTGGAATYLNHGGHLWDTGFDVMGTFGTTTENINALEAVSVPEPATFALLSLGLMGLGFSRRKAK